MAASPAVPTPVLNIETVQTSTEATVRCTGRLVADTCERLQQAVKEQIATKKLVVLDFSGVNYLDSSGLGAIVGLYASGKRSGCQLKLVNLTPRLKELFSMTRLFEVLESHSIEGMSGF